MDDAETLTQNSATAFLWGVAVVQGVAALRDETSPGAARANALGAAVCVVAAMHYGWMRDAKDERERLRLRYSDWFLTTPMLLYELQELVGVRREQRLRPLVAVCAMIVAGYIAARAERPMHRYGWFAIASALLAYIAMATWRDATADEGKTAAIVGPFFGVWSLYAAAFLAQRNVAFNLLDTVSKGAFGLWVAASLL